MFSGTGVMSREQWTVRFLGEIMKQRRRSPVHLILALLVVLAAWPLATIAQDATPPFEQSHELPQEQSHEPSAQQPPEEEQPQVVTEGEAPLPVESPPVDAPQEQVPAQSPQTSDQEGITAEQEGIAFVGLSFLQCENDVRAGEIDFLPSAPTVMSAANSTSDNCTPLSDDAYLEMYLVSIETEQLYLYEGFDLQVPPGPYVVAGWINDSYGKSAAIDLPDGTTSFVQAIYYTPESTPGDVEEGVGSVTVAVTQCDNWERAGELDFLISRPEMSTSAATDCLPVAVDAFSFTLVNADDPGTVLSPTSASGSEVAFTDVPSGSWYVAEGMTGNVSEIFTVSDGDVLQIAVISYVEGPIDVYVERIVCEDDARAGTTDFIIDASSSSLAARAESSTCYAVPPSGELPSASITLTNTDTGDTYTASLDSGNATFDAVSKGTYVATETLNGASVSSDPFVIDLPGKQIRVIDYIESDRAQPEPGSGFGIISGNIYYCSSPDREEGDVDFIVANQAFRTAGATSECESGGGATGGMLTLLPVDPGTGEPVAEGQAIWTDGVSFWQDITPAGTYILGYTSPYTGETLFSDPFAIEHRTETVVDINVYAEPAFTTYLDVWKDICVDPDRAGTTSFQLITEEEGFSVSAAEPSDCRYATSDDGKYTYTLTNLDTGESWTRTVLGGEGAMFDNLLAGTYTLAETHDGVTSTSDAFVLEPSIGQWHRMSVRNFIGERGWDEPPVNDAPSYIAIFSYGCANPNRDGGYEWFRYGQVQTGEASLAASDVDKPAPTPDTSACQPVSSGDGIVFIAEPVDGGPAIEFYESAPGFFEQWETDGIPAGDYIITETSTGATTGVVRVVGWTSFHLLLFEELPEAEVTLTVSSADPTIANTLPIDATWAVTSLRDPSITFSGTFAEDSLSLPTSIELGMPLTYGDYRVAVEATPTFSSYEAVFTVESDPSPDSVTVIQEILTFSVVLQPVIPSPSPSPTPTLPPGSTPIPTATQPQPPTPAGETTATATPGEAAVVRLPSTGGGEDESGHGAMLLLAALGAAIATTGSGLAIRRQRR
jgi:hypothetical protein